jgi:Peptidase S24-like
VETVTDGLFMTALDHRRDPNLQLAVQMRDESLSDLGIHTDDVCVVEINSDLFSDRLMAMTTDEGVLIRYVVKEDGQYILIPQNAAYAVRVLVGAEILGFVHTVLKATKQKVTTALIQQAAVLLITALAAKQALRTYPAFASTAQHAFRFLPFI